MSSGTLDGGREPAEASGRSRSRKRPSSLLRLRQRAKPDRDSGRFWQALGRTLKLVLLLLLIVAALLPTTLLDRPTQVFLLKVFLVLFLSLLPGWLYLQFIAIKGTGLYDEYVLNLYRLKIDDVANLPKPPPSSRYWPKWDAEVRQGAPDELVARNIYLKKFEAVYGRSAIPESRRKRHGDDDRRPVERRGRIVEQIQADAFSPVLMTTILLCIGWLIVVQPDLYRGLRPLGDLVLSGFPQQMPVDPLRYGFIGSYVFILQGLVRRYFQADLKTHAYVSAMARVILVAALVTAIHPLWSMWGLATNTELAFAFFLGFFPELGLRVIQQALLGVLRRARPAREERYPLRQLDGINIWTQARFLEEGIEDMQNLSTANLVDLMLHTRMPINRLLDWIDQAFLYVRVNDGNGHRDDAGDGGDRAKLRRYGIRTATDLLDAFEARSRFDRDFTQGLLRLLNDQPADKQPSVTEGLRRTLDSEVNLWHVRQWKQRPWLTSPRDDVRHARDSSADAPPQPGGQQPGEASAA